MKSKPANPINEDATCDECGKFGALEIGDRKLCAECVTLAGSACGGSPPDDDVAWILSGVAWWGNVWWACGGERAK